MMSMIKKAAVAAGAIYLAEMLVKGETIAKIPVIGSKPEIGRVVVDGVAVAAALHFLG